jgi:dihydrofolate synthase/folylpolyglutamate synthase
MEPIVQKTSDFGLAGMRRLLSEFGDPQNNIPVIHIAGTNGKGSTAACTAAILAASGLKTGLYTSPHIEKYNERLRILEGRKAVENWSRDPWRSMIPTADLDDLREEIEIARTRILPEVKMTVFDQLTASAFVWFAREGCQAMVIETGLGGELDATNVIDRDKVAVVTKIAVDHEKLLGHSLTRIAEAKAGIITERTCCLILDNSLDVKGDIESPDCQKAIDLQHEILQVFTLRCAKLKTPFVLTDETTIRVTEDGSDPQRPDEVLSRRSFSLSEFDEVFTAPLPGDHQVINAALSIRAARALAPQLVTVDSIRAGLAGVYWPGRLQLLLNDPPLIFDAAHNLQGMRSAARALDDTFRGQKILLLVAALADKDWKPMMRAIMTDRSFSVGGVYCVTANSDRALPARKLADWFRRLSNDHLNRYNVSDIAEFDEVEQAVRAVRQNQRLTGAPAFVSGSLYIAGEVMRVCSTISEEEVQFELERRGPKI